MNLPYRFQEEPGTEPVLSVDGYFGAPGLNLSHWPGHETPLDLRHDLSTGSALLFARLDEAERARRAEGVILGMENEASTSLSTAALTRRFIDQLGTASVRAIWDPANELYASGGITPFLGVGLPPAQTFLLSIVLSEWR